MLKYNLFFKRAFDFWASLVVCIILIPVWLLVSIFIKLDSKGPVFFKQDRRTKDGRVFQMLKFRSMVVNAEKIGTGIFSYNNDPRITKVGAILRRTSIDEIPQLLNVIMGDISIVGPRPCVTYELGDFDSLNQKYRKRFNVKGGITGLAQVEGRNENSWDEKVILDNEYIDRFSKEGVWLDFKIICKTIINVLSSKNINESKFADGISDVESTEMSNEEIIRLAHLPDKEQI